MSVRITIDKLPEEVRERLLSVARGLAGPVLRAGAMRAQALLAKRTPVYTGLGKAGWRVRQLDPKTGYAVENSAPYIGVVERGARPHPVSREGIEAIARWFELKGTKPSAKKIPRAAVRRRKSFVKRLLRRLLGAPGGRAGATAGKRPPRRRPVGLTKEEAMEAAQAFAWRLRKKGQKGTFFVQNSLPEVERGARAEVQRFLTTFARGPAK